MKSRSLLTLVAVCVLCCEQASAQAKTNRVRFGTPTIADPEVHFDFLVSMVTSALELAEVATTNRPLTISDGTRFDLLQAHHAMVIRHTRSLQTLLSEEKALAARHETVTKGVDNALRVESQMHPPPTTAENRTNAAAYWSTRTGVLRQELAPVTQKDREIQ